MAKKSFGNILIELLLVVLVLGLQLASTYYNQNFLNLFAYQVYGWESARAILLTALLGAASGIACVYLIRRQPKGETGESKAVNSGLIVLLGVAVLAVALKFVMGTAFWSIPFSVLRPGWSELFYWVIESQAPSLLLGFAIGGLVIK